MPSIPRSEIVFAVVLSLAAGCRRDEVTHFTVPKEQAAPAGALAAPSPMMGSASPSAGTVPPPPPPSERGSLKWTLPKGWNQTLGTGGMRYATLKAPVEGRVDVSVVVLPGPAGGELANVNRWRGQIGLGPVDDAALATLRRVVRTKAGSLFLYDLESEGTVRSHMTAGMIEAADGNTWFLKMVGDAGAVAKARPAFVQLLESIRFD